MNPLYSRIAERAGHRCEYCRAPEALFNFPFEVEHVTPTSRDGPDDESNAALACRSCNLFKSDHTSGADPETNLIVELFHPRRDSWDAHFRFARETARIEGITPIGRATVTTLRLNAPLQTAARLVWMRLGFFP